VTDPISNFLDAMGAAGVRPLEPIADKLATGVPVRFRADGDKPGRRNGWAVLHLDGVPAGVFRHYRLDIRQVWRADGDPLSRSPAERRTVAILARDRTIQRSKETVAKQQAAAGQARDLWHSASKAEPGHDYLARKGLPAFNIRQHGDALLVPMVDSRFQLMNLQRIYPDGRKFFLSGGRTEGMFWPRHIHQLGGAVLAGPLVIGEGFATMAAVHHATGHGVAAAMSAHNLARVARVIRKLFPCRPLIIAADNDDHLPKNVGLNAALRAAKIVGALVAVPRSAGHHTCFRGSGTDFADLSQPEIAACFAAARKGGNVDA
jgi:putative DNA primase/helicase